MEDFSSVQMPASGGPDRVSLLKVEHDSGSYHSFTQQEIQNYSEHLNSVFSDDPELQNILPINLQNPQSLFEALANGILLCKLINYAKEDTIAMRAVNMKQPLSVYKIDENLMLAKNAAQAIGIKTVNIHVENIRQMKENIVLGLIWQIIRLAAVEKINLKECPFLFRLKEENEELADLLKLPPEQLLLRWLNFHLKNSGSDRRVQNFGKDLCDGEVYLLVLNQLDKNKCKIDGYQQQSPDERATKAIQSAKDMGVETHTKPREITSGNPKLNLLFCAQIFNHIPGLEPIDEITFQKEFAELLDQDTGDSREERQFRFWINSLDLEGIQLDNLYEGVRDGIVLLKVIDKLQPGLIKWEKVEKKPNHVLKQVQNCNYVVQLGKELGLNLVAIGGKDFVDKNKKLILAMVWQLMRKNVLQTLGGIKEEELVAWSNSMVGSNYEPITNFKDKKLKDGKYLLHLLQAIDKDTINWEVIPQGDSDDDIKITNQYVISVARKLGACIFLVWEDIKEVNPKMIMTFVAAVKEIQKNKK